MPDEKAPAAPAPATPPAAEGQPGAQPVSEPPKTIPYDRFAEVVAERNALRDEKAASGWQPPAHEPAAPEYTPQPQGDGDLANLESELGLAPGRLMKAFAPALTRVLNPVVETAFSTYEETSRARDPYFGVYEQSYKGYVRQGYAPNVAMRLARGDKVTEIATKMMEDRAKEAARPVGRFTGEPVSPGAEGPNGLSQSQEQLANEWELDAEVRQAAAAERAKRLQR